MAYFPMFTDLTGKNCLVVGGGQVAVRKVRTMLDFGLTVTLAAPHIDDTANMPGVDILRCEFSPELLENADVVIAATDDKELNADIAALCRERGIPVNAVDSAKDSTFIFPSYIREGDVVAAFSSSGQSPLITQYLKKETESLLTPFIGEVAQLLGSLREDLKERTSCEAQRKEIYKKILTFAFESGVVPTADEAERIIKRKIQQWKEQDD